MAAEIIGQVAGPLVRLVAEYQDFLHALIVSSAVNLGNMQTRRLIFKTLLIGLLVLAATTAGAAEKIFLQALFKDKAIIVVDGARHVLKSGETSSDGVKLLATDTQEEKADIEIDGKHEVLRLGMVVAVFNPKGKGSVVLYPDRGGHFFADGQINGTTVRFMVDTGATVVAMNSVTANRIGIDYIKNGHPGVASTPAGYVRTYDISLNTVQVGGIKLYNVHASVIEGSHPQETLLGMSFLGQLDMRRDSEKMELSER
jgi:aspartyl protease family protein